jgi:hypothetical protein
MDRVLSGKSQNRACIQALMDVGVPRAYLGSLVNVIENDKREDAP